MRVPQTLPQTVQSSTRHRRRRPVIYDGRTHRRRRTAAARGAAAAAGTWTGASLAQKLHEKLYPSLDEPSRGRLAPVRSVVRDCYAIVGGGGGELGV